MARKCKAALNVNTGTKWSYGIPFCASVPLYCLRMRTLLFSFNKKEEKTAEWNWCICPIENSLVGRKQSKEDQEVHSLNSISGFLISHRVRDLQAHREALGAT